MRVKFLAIMILSLHSVSRTNFKHRTRSFGKNSFAYFSYIGRLFEEPNLMEFNLSEAISTSVQFNLI
jgi:hypothetical protein